jgi:putative endonuclease
MSAYLYVLRSASRNRHYIGATNDMRRRLDEHQRGQTSSTRTGRPWELIWLVEFANIKQAKYIERALKALKSRVFLEEMIKNSW